MRCQSGNDGVGVGVGVGYKVCIQVAGYRLRVTRDHNVLAGNWLKRECVLFRSDDDDAEAPR